jgi:hypothetical protein
LVYNVMSAATLHAFLIRVSSVEDAGGDDYSVSSGVSRRALRGVSHVRVVRVF